MRPKLSKKVIKLIGKTNANYSLIKENDKILVGLSGGKDSLSLVHSLKQIQRQAPFDFEFLAVTVSYGMGENLQGLQEHCKKHNIPHKIYDTPIYDLAKEKIRKNSSFCSFFSRMRRGALYCVAQEMGYTKLALGHHLDDAMESFFMNMFYNGQMRTMPPRYRAKNGIMVIRPMLFVRERMLIDMAIENKWECISDEACPAMRFDVKMPVAREKIKSFVSNLEQDYKNVATLIKSSFGNISDNSFFDESRLDN